jgi:hypothetical protein
MSKSRAALRPVIAAQRVDRPLYEAIKAEAASSGRSLAEELTALARGAIENRKRFGDTTTARAVEMATVGFLLAGERKAREKGLNQPWSTDLECRREAALVACTQLVTMFVSSDPNQQALTVESLKGRIWTDIVQQAQREGRFPWPQSTDHSTGGAS